MERWAAGPLGADVSFVCVCVDRDSERTARAFVSELGLKHAAVGFLEPNRGDGIRFPSQLGCQGFAVLDAQLRFVATATFPSYVRSGQPGLDAAEEAARGAAELALRIGGAGQLAGQAAVEVPAAKGVPEGHTAVRLESGEVIAVPDSDIARPPLAEDAVCDPCSLTDATALAAAPEVECEPCGACGQRANPFLAGGGEGKAGQVGEEEDAPQAKRQKQSAGAGPPAAGGASADVATSNSKAEKAPAEENEGGDDDWPMVGNSVLDAEHNHLGAALRNADSKIALVAAVVEMEEHFAHEEAMLREADFPTRALAGHIADHDRIRALAADAIAHLSLAGDPPVLNETRAILAAVGQHTRQFDVLYAAVVGSRGAYN